MAGTFTTPELAEAAHDAYHVYGFVVGDGMGSDDPPTQEQKKVVGICAEIHYLIKQLDKSAAALSGLLSEPVLTTDFGLFHHQSTARESEMRRHNELLGNMIYQLGTLKYLSAQQARVFQGASELDRRATIYQVLPDGPGGLRPEQTHPGWRVRIAHPRTSRNDAALEEVLWGFDNPDFAVAHRIALNWVNKGELPIWVF